MRDEWDVIGYVISSRYRIVVLRGLATGPATPSQLASDAGVAITHVSRALRGLRERTLVELLVPEERKKGRVYGITEQGNQVWEQILAKDLVE